MSSKTVLFVFLFTAALPVSTLFCFSDYIYDHLKNNRRRKSGREDEIAPYPPAGCRSALPTYSYRGPCDNKKHTLRGLYPHRVCFTVYIIYITEFYSPSFLSLLETLWLLLDEDMLLFSLSCPASGNSSFRRFFIPVGLTMLFLPVLSAASPFMIRIS